MKKDPPLKIGIVGVVHGHVHGFLHDAMRRDDVELMGVVEEDATLLKAYSEQYGVDESLRFTNLVTFLDEQKPEALTVFSNTFDHRDIVVEAAKRGVHVMMEKPLAVNMEHANVIQKAADEGGIHVLVNYETTWYPSNQAVYDATVNKGTIGVIRKIVVHDGHWGPKEIGVSEEFLSWLTDPVLNGGGALTDFGCYGANLMTWLLKGQQPLSVSAVMQQVKTDPVYSKVDDEATIIIEYPQGQGIIQASWNWPYHRKDMEVYGDLGYAHAVDGQRVRAYSRSDEERNYSTNREGRDDVFIAEPVAAPHNDPLTYLRAVIRGEIEMAPYDLSALENNMMVTRILDAARHSANTGERVVLE